MKLKRSFTEEELKKLINVKKAKMEARKLPSKRDGTKEYKEHMNIWEKIKNLPMRDLTDSEKKTRKKVEDGSPYTHVVQVSKKRQDKMEITKARRQAKLNNKQIQRDSALKKRVLKERKKKGRK